MVEKDPSLNQISDDDYFPSGFVQPPSHLKRVFNSGTQCGTHVEHVNVNVNALLPIKAAEGVEGVEGVGYPEF